MNLLFIYFTQKIFILKKIKKIVLKFVQKIEGKPNPNLKNKKNQISILDDMPFLF